MYYARLGQRGLKRCWSFRHKKPHICPTVHFYGRFTPKTSALSSLDFSWNLLSLSFWSLFWHRLLSLKEGSLRVSTCLLLLQSSATLELYKTLCSFHLKLWEPCEPNSHLCSRCFVFCFFFLDFNLHFLWPSSVSLVYFLASIYRLMSHPSPRKKGRN
jgi:hypothetical protein